MTSWNSCSLSISKVQHCNNAEFNYSRRRLFVQSRLPTDRPTDVVTAKVKFSRVRILRLQSTPTARIFRPPSNVTYLAGNKQSQRHAARRAAAAAASLQIILWQIISAAEGAWRRWCSNYVMLTDAAAAAAACSLQPWRQRPAAEAGGWQDKQSLQQTERKHPDTLTH